VNRPGPDRPDADPDGGYPVAVAEEIGLFPLELVLFPTERVPLHIFEPRYKELIGECLDEDREFGLVLADAGGRRDVGTRAAVVKVLQVFDDGRLNIVIEGRDRFRIVGETGGRSFATGEVEPLEDAQDPPSDDDVSRAVELFGQLLEIAEAEGVEPPTPGAEALSFELAARVDFGADVKQEILELCSERERLRRLAQLFEAAVRALSLEKEVRERAAGNGKVSRRDLQPPRS
jgi:Lon protease-like protein